MPRSSRTKKNAISVPAVESPAAKRRSKQLASAAAGPSTAVDFSANVEHLKTLIRKAPEFGLHAEHIARFLRTQGLCVYDTHRPKSQQKLEQVAYVVVCRYLGETYDGPYGAAAPGDIWVTVFMKNDIERPMRYVRHCGNNLYVNPQTDPVRLEITRCAHGPILFADAVRKLIAGQVHEDRSEDEPQVYAYFALPVALFANDVFKKGPSPDAYAVERAMLARVVEQLKDQYRPGSLEGLVAYMARSECRQDADDIYTALNKKIVEIRAQLKDGDPRPWLATYFVVPAVFSECTVCFATNVSRAIIDECIESVEDSHVFFESLQPIELFDGERRNEDWNETNDPELALVKHAIATISLAY